MATKKVGALVKEARTNAGLTQEQLAKKVTGASAADISSLERGKVDFTQAQLKQIAKACNVTQSSLVNAPKNLGTAAKKSTSTAKTSTSKTSASKTASTSAAKKTTSSKTSSTASKSSTAKKSTSSPTSTKKTTSTTGTSMKVSATEKKLVELYRDADSATKKVVMGILKGELPEPPMPPDGFGLGGHGPLANTQTSATGTQDGSIMDDFVGSIISGALQMLGRR